MLRNQTSAPQFTLRDQHGTERTLTELRGDKPLILFFYRGAFCGTSRKQLIDYADNHSRIQMANAEIVAISADTPQTSRVLADDLEVEFPLLYDADFEVSPLYGVYRSDDDEGPQPHGEPAVFIVDIDGNIAFWQLQSGPRASADPADLALILLYMRENGGRY